MQPFVTTTYNLTASNSAGTVTIPFTIIVGDGGNPADADTDGDGWTDLQESFLGTNPLDPKDAFRVLVFAGTTFGSPGDQIEYQLRWNSATGRTYTIESSDDLKTWTQAAVIAGDGAEQVHTVRTTQSIGFFRMRVD